MFLPQNLRYKRLDPIHVGCQGNPGLCVYKGVLECERNPACGAISWWLGAMGHSRRNNGDAGSVFLVAGVTMANIHTTARKHQWASAMVKNSACRANMGSSSSSFLETFARKSPTGVKTSEDMSQVSGGFSRLGSSWAGSGRYRKYPPSESTHFSKQFCSLPC